MVIDRVTGAISLNRKSTCTQTNREGSPDRVKLTLPSFLLLDRASAPGRLSPVAHEDVITVYGILGIVSLVTSEFSIVSERKGRDAV